LRLNRPAKRNAITREMYRAMAEALIEAEAPDGPRIVLISGAGEAFCAGNDLADFLASPDVDPQTSPVGRFLAALTRSTRVLVAAVQGNVVGIGFTLLLHCDFVLAEAGTVLHLPFIDLAVVPEAGSSLLLPARIGHLRAAELLLLGEKLPATRAAELGLVSRVVAAGTGLAEATSLAERLAAKPASALLASKKLLVSTTPDLAGRIDEEFAAFAAQLESPELKAAIAAFYSRRSAA
jgi:enoyl-CoA hydratase/carnithine racemase